VRVEFELIHSGMTAIESGAQYRRTLDIDLNPDGTRDDTIEPRVDLLILSHMLYAPDDPIPTRAEARAELRRLEAEGARRSDRECRERYEATLRTPAPAALCDMQAGCPAQQAEHPLQDGDLPCPG
jgi:hypothetical protein